MTLLMLLGCLLAIGVAAGLSLLVHDALRRQRADDDARAARRAQALRRPSAQGPRLVPPERRRLAQPVQADRRRAA